MNENMMCDYCSTPVAELAAPSEKPVSQDWIAVGEKRCQGRENCILSLEPNSTECIEVVTSSNS